MSGHTDTTTEEQIMKEIRKTYDISEEDQYDELRYEIERIWLDAPDFIHDNFDRVLDIRVGRGPEDQTDFDHRPYVYTYKITDFYIVVEGDTNIGNYHIVDKEKEVQEIVRTLENRTREMYNPKTVDIDVSNDMENVQFCPYPLGGSGAITW